MDFDLEIISEEGDRQDPLFDSIMNAMNSMKEATADKIYRKIQKEGITNYSKPQVDRALENALKYGIFEVKNNRYRVRDDVLDDEDTVYWKLQKNREKTPFRIEGGSDKQSGLKLDPERDNQRFRRPPNKFEECPHCGRTKKPGTAGGRNRTKKSGQKSGARRKKTNKERMRCDLKRRIDSKRKDDKYAKRRKSNTIRENKAAEFDDENLGDIKDEMDKSQDEISDSSDSEMDTLDTPRDTKYNKPYQGKKYYINKGSTAPQSTFSSECITADLDILKTRGSTSSLKTESESEKTFASSTSEGNSQPRTADGFFEERPCTSKNASSKMRSQYLSSGEVYRNQYERGQTETNKGNPDWLGCSNEPQGAVIQSNNVLTIEPMDSLAFKNPEHTSYIS